MISKWDACDTYTLQNGLDRNPAAARFRAAKRKRATSAGAKRIQFLNPEQARNFLPLIEIKHIGRCSRLRLRQISAQKKCMGSVGRTLI
jgi:hypothetical protein